MEKAAFQIRLVIPSPSDGSGSVVFERGDRQETLHLSKEVLITNEHVTNATVEKGPNDTYVVLVHFSEAGAEAFAHETGAAIGERLAILVDGRVLLAARIHQEITDGVATITGTLGLEEAQMIAASIGRHGRHIHEVEAEESPYADLAGEAKIPLAELFPESLENKAGKPVARDEALEGKLIGIYFSAEGCPPCRAFTPTLVEFRDKYQDEFEVVFVSSDPTPNAQRQYMERYKMDFLAVENNSDTTKKLRSKFSLQGIPTLVVVGPDGRLITKNGRIELSQDSETALENWKSQLTTVDEKEM